ncbi:PREDICTED: uncharacterized protein LOC104587856 [Nelumbo nucifera]|uniref:Uncharacterized protein LOC104587856 n=1 Tax=Nelumbo nucifera TaxID=4432 RepID=A0A1U7Z9V1_NELNU|nr:PREDICTED: uncharacterized protein LOC104587856 [Nelumbo nucifera]
MVKLNEECSAILQNKLPPKLKDPESFSISCTIENAKFEKALCDLGASINLMPYSIFKRLRLHELTPTTITLQLADRSIKYPRGIVEDVLVKVGNFIIPADFIVLDMEEDRTMPLILGRPFLTTGNALIDVQKGLLTLRINGEEVVFNVFQTKKYPNRSEHEIYAIDCIDVWAAEINTSKLDDPFESCILNSCKNMQVMEEEVKEAMNYLEASQEECKPRQGKFLPLDGPTSTKQLLPSIKAPPALELKPLPFHLKYIFLGESSTLPVIISADLTSLREEKLVRVLK